MPSNQVETPTFPRYEEFAYLYPPRPDNAIPPALLGAYEKKNWIAQVKKNGTCNVIAVSPKRELVVMNRHKEEHSLWTPTAASNAAFKAIPGKGWWVFVGELLHSKVTDGPKDTNYLFDCVVANGDYLVGSTYADRYDRLTDAFPIAGETDDALKINDKTFILANFQNDFRGLFDSLRAAEDEGLVLKDPNAKLRYCTREKANSAGQVKCRMTNAKNGAF